MGDHLHPPDRISRRLPPHPSPHRNPLATLAAIAFTLVILILRGQAAQAALPGPASSDTPAAAPDFTLTVEPDKRTVLAGETAVYQVTVTSVEGFQSPVTLSVTRRPTNASVRFPVNPVTPTRQVEMRVDTTVAVPSGIYTLTLVGEGPGGDPLHSVNFFLEIEETNLYLRIVRFLLIGVGVTLQITLGGIALALIVGLLIGIMRTTSLRPFYLFSTAYVEVIRGIPLLVLLFYIYFGIGGLVPLEPVPASIIGLGLGYGAYMGETYRAGIQSIHKGQWEAARSLGMTYWQAMRYIVLPQAIRRILPPLGNDCVAMLKDSALASTVGVGELARRGREFTAASFRPFETWNMVALLYLIMTFVFSQVVQYVERRMAAGE